MLGQLMAILLAFALWPLLVLSAVVSGYVLALWIQLPRLHTRYGGLIAADVMKWLGV